MKLIVILVDEARAGQLEQVLQAQALPGFTEIPNVLGMGATGRKLGTRAFPGSSRLYMAAAAEEKLDALVKTMREMQHTHRIDDGLRAYCLDAQEVL